jgi:uncharacterized protein YbjT (DUF2867 family)
MRIAVAGGTGVVGRHLVAALRGAGHEPVVLARSVGVDLTTGAGVDDALRGVGAVVDVSNVATTRRSAAEAFFAAATGSLLEAGRRAGVGHHVVLSIVGVDRVELGYYLGKRLQERLVLDSGVPVTVLRATQFHEFAGQLLDRVAGPVALVPRMRVQPVAAREVAGALAGLVAGPAVGRAPEIAGPEEHDLVDLARRYLRARGRRRPVLAVPLPGAAGRQIADGALLPDESGARGRETFDHWLAGLSAERSAN